MSALPSVGVSATTILTTFVMSPNLFWSIIRKIRELNCGVESHSLLYCQHTNVTETENNLHVAIITSNFYAGVPEKLSHEIKFIDI